MTTTILVCYELSESFELTEGFVNIMKMVSPALDNNPRRLKQFHNMFRFHKYIGRGEDWPLL